MASTKLPMIMTDEDKQIIRNRAYFLLEAPDTVFVDFETTELRHPEMVEIAIVSVSGEVLMRQRVKPDGPISEEAQATHGIRAEMVADCPGFADVYPALLALLNNHSCVSYNKTFDKRVLERECDKIGVPRPEITRWVCAMEMRRTLTGERLPLGGGHDAVGDCLKMRDILREIAGSEEV